MKKEKEGEKEERKKGERQCHVHLGTGTGESLMHPAKDSRTAFSLLQVFTTCILRAHKKRERTTLTP